MTTRKTHLRRNKANDQAADIAACATNPHVVGKARPNGRRTYQFMASEIVSWKEFQTVPAANRCLHCMEAGLVIRNNQRKAKGLPLVATIFEGCAAAEVA